MPGFSTWDEGRCAIREISFSTISFRVVNEAQPAFFLAENVLGILHKAVRGDGGIGIGASVSQLRDPRPGQNRAADYGAPTSRTRVFFFGYLPDRMEKLSSGSFDPPNDLEPVLVRDALEGLPVHVDPKWQKEEDGWRGSESHGNGYFSIGSRVCSSGVGDAVALQRLETEGLSSGTLGTCHSQKVANRYAILKHGERDKVSKLNVWTRKVFVRLCVQVGA